MNNARLKLQINQKKYKRSYSDQKFWKKLKSLPGTAGCKIIRTAVTLYAVLTQSHIPLWAKTSIILALGYFISPVDAIPDFIIPAGYIDDLAVMASVLARLHSYKNNNNVKQKVDTLLPDICLDPE